MKTTFHAALGILLFNLCVSPHTGRAQGSLIPPGALAPTMKTLDQVEPRTAITNLPIVFSQGGSYYLTKSFVQGFSSDAITISADNVTIDFCGFTVQQTNATASIVGIRLESTAVNTPLRNAVIKNGTIAGFAAVGVTSLGGRNCLFEDFSVMGCSGGGISFQAFGTAGAVGNIFRRCRTSDNVGGTGILLLSGASNVGNLIMDCESLNNTTGFAIAEAGNLMINCRTSGNANNYSIGAGNREGLLVLPSVNSIPLNGSTGGSGSGTTDPFANLSY